MPLGPLRWHLDKGVQFPNGFTNDDENVIEAFRTVEAARNQKNTKRTEVTFKPNKQAHTRKNKAAIGV